jgi:hypothetical protein
MNSGRENKLTVTIRTGNNLDKGVLPSHTKSYIDWVLTSFSSLLEMKDNHRNL